MEVAQQPAAQGASPRMASKTARATRDGRNEDVEPVAA
jgi:hypothetical protein